MDALKLRLRAKDELHPILQELVTGYARFKGSKDWEGRSRMVSWYVLHISLFFQVLCFLFVRWGRWLVLLDRAVAGLSRWMRWKRLKRLPTSSLGRCAHSHSSFSFYAVLTRNSQLLFDVDHAYAEFFRSLSGTKEDESWTWTVFRFISS